MAGACDIIWCFGGEKRVVAVREGRGLAIPAGAMSRLACRGKGHDVSKGENQRDLHAHLPITANKFLQFTL